MALLESLLSAVAGGAVSLGGRQLLVYWRRPKLSLDLHEAGGQRPYIAQRTLIRREAKNEQDAVASGELVKDIHLIVQNQGYRPAKGCEARLDIYHEGEEIPKPIRLGWRRRPPIYYQDLNDWEIMRQRTAPVDINRKSHAQLDLLRLRTVENKLTTLSSFRSHDFEKDTEYRLDLTITSSNADPRELSLRLNWNGGDDDLNLQEAITITE